VEVVPVDRAVEENTGLVVLVILHQQVLLKEIQEVVCVLEVLIHILPEVVVAVAVLELVVLVVVLEEMVVMVYKIQLPAQRFGMLEAVLVV
jgi:hypothetical protein